MNRLLWALFLTLLNRAIAAAEFQLYASDTPLGKRIGGHDIPGVKDKFLVLVVGLRNWKRFTGYWQSA